MTTSGLERLLRLASTASTADLAEQLAAAVAREPVALARVWLTDADCLRLAGSAGIPTGGGSYARIDGTFSRIAIGDGKIGRIAASRTSQVVLSLRGDEDWLANPAWIARQGVRAFVGHPLNAGSEVLGVIAIFCRTRPSDEDLTEWAFLARFAAARLVDLRSRAALHARAEALERIVADRLSPTRPAAPAPTPPPALAAIVTRGELRAFEKETLEAALTESAGRVFGARGAAAILGMKPTTLASRMKALGIPAARSLRQRLVIG